MAQVSEVRGMSAPRDVLIEEEPEEHVEHANSENSERRQTGRQHVRQCIRGWWKTCIIVLTPLIFSPIPLSIKTPVSEDMSVVDPPAI